MWLTPEHHSWVGSCGLLTPFHSLNVCILITPGSGIAGLFMVLYLSASFHNRTKLKTRNFTNALKWFILCEQNKSFFTCVWRKIRVKACCRQWMFMFRYVMLWWQFTNIFLTFKLKIICRVILLLIYSTTPHCYCVGLTNWTNSGLARINNIHKTPLPATIELSYRFKNSMGVNNMK